MSFTRYIVQVRYGLNNHWEDVATPLTAEHAREVRDVYAKCIDVNSQVRIMVETVTQHIPAAEIRP